MTMLKIVVELYNGTKEFELSSQELSSQEQLGNIVRGIVRRLTIEDLIMLHKIKIVYEDRNLEHVARLIKDEFVKKLRELFFSLIMLSVPIVVEEGSGVRMIDEVRKSGEMLERLERVVGSSGNLG